MVISGHHSGIKVWGGRRGIVLLFQCLKPDSLQNGQMRANRGDLLRSLALRIARVDAQKENEYK